MTEWLLTQTEGEKAVVDWVKQDWATREISLNRGHWEEIVPILVQAQLRKVVERLQGDGCFNVHYEDWQELLKEAGKEEVG